MDLDLNKIFLMREKKGYRITYAMSHLILKTTAVSSPFGIEDYNKKEILNLEIKKSNNDQYNFYSSIYALDKEFENKIEFSGKTYRSCIKNNLLRCHLKKNIDIFKLEENKKIYLSRNDITKNKNIICDLHISNIWEYGSDYGLIIYINSIQIV